MHSLCPPYNSYSPHTPLRPSHIRNLALVFTGAIHCIPPHTCSLDILLHFFTLYDVCLPALVVSVFRTDLFARYTSLSVYMVTLI